MSKMLCLKNDPKLKYLCQIAWFITQSIEIYSVPPNKKKIEQTTTAVWLITLFEKSLLFFPNGLTPKNFDFYQRKFF